MRTLKKGHYCELLAAAILHRNDYDVFHPLQGHGPVDLVAIKLGETLLLDVKADSSRLHSGRTTPTRITRPRTKLQKQMSVRICYVDVRLKKLHITDHISDCQDAQPIILT